MPTSPRATRTGRFGMVASTHWLASSAAMAMLDAGGNAFDAAVAGAFVLHVVEPHLNGPGGDVPAIFATAQDPTPTVLCGQGPVPAAATPEAFTALGLGLVPGSGPLAAVVPGAVDAWFLLLREHGTMTLAEVLAPAVTLARDGHRLLPAVTRTIAAVERLFTEHWPTSAAHWLPGGQVPAPWQRHRNPAWAAVLERLAACTGATREAAIDAARMRWREGFVAEEIVAFQRRSLRDSSGADHPGLLAAGDLAGWRAGFEAPALGTFGDATIAKTGPWGQGPVLLQTLALLDGSLPDLGTAEGVHVTVEALKLAFADREAFYGDDPTVPLAALLDPDYARARRALIGDVASSELRPGRPGGREPRLPDGVAGHGFAGGAGAGLGEPTVGRHGEQRGDTCHLDVIDSRGNIISATPSGGWLQSSPVIPALGFPLGSRAQMTWLQPGLASTLTPGRRPRTTLSPTLVLRDGVPVLACGTPGGDQQDQWQVLFLLRHLGAGVDLQAAIDAPAWHTTSFPSSFYPREMEPAGLVVESRLGADAIAELRARGHQVTVSGAWTLGRLCAVGRDPVTHELTAAATSRGGTAYALGR